MAPLQWPKVAKKHVCHFYEDRQDLIDVLVPFFKEGLEKDEFCLWGCDVPLPPEEARHELAKAVPDLDYYLDRRQIEIFPITQLYHSRFHPQAVYESFLKKVKESIGRGFRGFRCDGNTGGVPSKDWLNFLVYESYVQAGIQDFEITAMCSYPLHRCSDHEIESVSRTHQTSLIKRAKRWEFATGVLEPKLSW